MSREIDLKNLIDLRNDIIEETNLKNELSKNKQDIETFENNINNPEKYVLKNAKSTNNRKKLEKEFKTELEEKYEVNRIPEILKGLINFRFWKLIVFIVAFILFVIIGEAIYAPMVAENPALESDATFNANGEKLVIIVFFSLIVLINVVPVIIRLIIRAIKSNKLKHLKFTQKQQEQLEEASKTDKENEKHNQKMTDKEKEVFKKNQIQYLIELKEKVEKLKIVNKDLDVKVSEITNKIEKNDCIGNQEKVLEIIEMLIYFIETKRADSIKEALHEYDNIRYNEAQLMIEQQKLALQQQKIEQERLDRQEKMEQDRRHQSEVEFQLRQEAMDRQKIASDINVIGRDIYYNK